jgi:hypothetical protein
MDFMHDVLADGAKIRLLTIVDSFSRESLALEVPLGSSRPTSSRCFAADEYPLMPPKIGGEFS